MKKTIQILSIVCFFLAIGICSQAQGYCNNSNRYATCNSYGAGNAGGDWLLTSPTGNAQLVVDLNTYDQLGDAIADVGSSNGEIQAMYNIWGFYQHDGTNVYLNVTPGDVTIYISIYASPYAQAHASVILF